jgi:4-hydroxythreonine-4-phosphate dehydrogenase
VGDEVTGTPLPLALTMGEPAGIGPDVTIAAWLRRSEFGLPPFYCLADPDLITARAAAMGVRLPVESLTPAEAASAFDRALPVVKLDSAVVARAGTVDATNAPAVIEAIARAVGDIRSGAASAIVTNPINKHALYQAGFNHPGHTEFLGALSAAWTGAPVKPVMMLAGPELKAIPVTIHIPIHAVAAALTAELIIETARIAAHDLRHRFGIAAPRLAISGLNPHAGESGTIGEEDERVVKPAIAALREQGIDARGPLPADSMFHPAARSLYDAALCMYHDQALIPAKTLAFSETVNVTLGLPFVRTSPDHGTALDIAGSGRADPTSLAAALRLAAELCRHEAGQ